MPTIIRGEFWIFLILGVILLTNVGVYFRNRKLDRLSTEELQGFTKKEVVKGLVIGLVTVISFIGITITFIFR